MILLGVAPLPLAALAALIVLAAALHRLGGQGFGTVVAPFAALLAPAHVPATVLLLGVVVTALGAGFDLKGVRPGEIAWAAAGRLAGTVPAVAVVGAVAGSPLLGPAVAAMILLGVGLSLAGLTLRKTRGTLLAAGVLSGFMGTLTSVGAAPMGLIYQNEAAKAARATLNAFFLLGVLFSVGGLAVSGLVTREHLLLALLLSPLVLLGFRLAGPLARRTEALPLKPAALGLATLGAVLLIVKSLL